MVINNIYLPNFWQRNVASAVKKKRVKISVPIKVISGMDLEEVQGGWIKPQKLKQLTSKTCKDVK